MTKPPPGGPDRRARFEELLVERLVLQDPQGRLRAVLETVGDPRDPPAAPAVRLTLLAATGDPMVVAEVDGAGRPVLHLGHPDRGATITVTREGIELWARGNVVAWLGSTPEGGALCLYGQGGNPVLTLPNDITDARQ